jgi:ketosteroid isomerase-like protein
MVTDRGAGGSAFGVAYRRCARHFATAKNCLGSITTRSSSYANSRLDLGRRSRQEAEGDSSTMTQAKTDDQKHFESFMQTRIKAADSYANGDSAPVLSLLTRHAKSTFFGPGGGYTEGAREVASTHEKAAQAFQPGGKNELELLQVFAGESVAYWVGIQHAKVRMRGKDELVPMSLRVTEVFRREGDDWKLVHRHADMLAQKS